MTKAKTATMDVQGTAITVLSTVHSDRADDFICLTDIARHKNAEGTDDLIRNWLRNRNTVEIPGNLGTTQQPAF